MTTIVGLSEEEKREQIRRKIEQVKAEKAHKQQTIMQRAKEEAERNEVAQ